MSWIENIDRNLVITCGDGRKYEPSWIRSTIEADYNTAQYEFMEVSGTLVRKYKPKGARYDIKICFQGEEHLGEVAQFLESAKDSRPWTIQHPLYGILKLQPLRLKIDDTSINVTEISGPFVETITEENPKTAISKPFKIIGDKQKLDDLIADYYKLSLAPSSTVINKLTPATQVITVQRRNLSQMYQSVSKKAKGVTDTVQHTLDADAYFNAFNKAYSAVLNVTTAPLDAARAVIDFINAPFQFKNSVVSRVNSLVAAFDMIRLSIDGLAESGAGVLTTKKIYETNGAAVISSMATASILQFDQANNELTDSPTVDGTNFRTPDYLSRVDVVAVMETLMDKYNTYVEDLDSLQTDNGGELESFIPEPHILEQLSEIINFTIAELMSIVLTGRQERVIRIEEDTNLISLAHRLYGLDDDDLSIRLLMETNKIGINELLKILKGRQIIYYV